MPGIKSQHSRILEELIAKRRLTLLESLVSNLDPTIAGTIVGTIRGLDEALKLSEEADFNISGEEPIASS